MSWVVLAVVMFLAWSNGSNDNFKGVATIYGSGTASYRASLWWATITTVAGSMLTLALAAGLLDTFSAKGLVPDAVAASSTFLAAAALGAAVTVLAATVIGMPVSTTHALTGALIGAGVSSGSGVHFGVLGKSFLLPLILSPVLAMALTTGLYPLARALRARLGIERQSCVCIGEELAPVAMAADGSGAVDGRVRLAVSAGASCVDRYPGAVVGVSAQCALDTMHFVSAGAVCFARGLNDTPKIVAILLAAKAVGAPIGLGGVAVAMALGGLLGARKVADTMSKKIVTLNAGQGFVANVTTAALVIAASRFGLPVSTTHVATGGLFGIGAINGTAKGKTIVSILIAWLTTLPMGAAVAALAYFALAALQ
ncbi:MAG TPA: anion permease [Polyangia bacterium]